jgi:hypothetical protein
LRKIAIASLLSLTIPVIAQMDRGTITGTITDATGARVDQADVIIQSNSTGVENRSITNSAGVFTVSSLQTDTYTITIRSAGFAPIKIENVTLSAGQTRSLDTKLTMASVTSDVQVSSDSDLAKASAEIGGVISGEQARELPLNGRSYVSLVSLVPGVIDTGSGGGSQQSVRFAGQSNEDNTWRLDGVDNSGINHSYQKVNARLQPSTEAIAEFRAYSLGYGADLGGSPGGQVVLVSRSGSNQYHGSGWEFIRNNIFDAAPWGSHGTLPPLRLNDFGGNFGGAAIKDKLFFFVNYEGLRQNQTQVKTGYVPSASFAASVLAANPGMAPILKQYPTGTVATSNPSVMQWYGNGRSVDTEDSGLARVDYHVNSKMNVFARYNTDHFSLTAPGDLTANAFTTLTTPNLALGATNTISPTLINDFRFGVNRAEFGQGSTNVLPYSVVVSGLTTLDNNTANVRYDTSYNTVDDVTMVRGRHTVKFGANIRRIQENKQSPSLANQVFTYQNLTTFAANQLQSDSYAGTVPLTGQRMTQWAGYVMDTFQVSPSLTLTYGLRYEYFGVDHEVEGRGVVYDPLNCPNVQCPAGTSWYQPNLLDFSPRVGFAYSPQWLGGKTVVRGGFGIYYGDGQFGGLGIPPVNISNNYTLVAGKNLNLSFPDTVFLGQAQTSFSPQASPTNRKDTAVKEYTLSIQHELPKNTVMQVAYYGTRSQHVFSDWTLNGYLPGTTTRPYAGYSTLDYRATYNDANYNALQVGLNRNFTSGLLISANYQWSHSLDNGGSGGGEADIPQNFNCHSCEYASSGSDMRHYFTTSTVWKLPVGAGHSFLGNAHGLTQALLGGWEMTGIGTAHSGLPINVTVARSTSSLPDGLTKNQRPNLVPGVPLYIGDFLNPAAFSMPANGTWGNAPRNVARAPGLWQIDAALSKRFAITEKFGLSFRAEAFNLFNIAHYGTPNSVWAPATSTSSNPNNFGVITSSFNNNPVGIGTPRELQFMLRADF